MMKCKRAFYIGVFSALLFSNVPAWSCEGGARDEALSIAHEALMLGAQSSQGIRDDFMARTKAITKRLAALPKSCHGLFQQVTSVFQSEQFDGTEKCMDGICCDSSGCFDR